MKKFLTAAVAVSVLASAGVASAQPYRHDNPRYEQRDDRRDNRYERRADRRYDAGRYNAPRHYQARNWRRGDRLPDSYRQGHRVDHRRYGLGAPPRGYEYTRVGNDTVLAAVATGLIVSVITGMFN